MTDDILQEAYIRVLQSARQDADQNQLRTYLFRISTNLLHDHGRRIQKEKIDRQADPDQLATAHSGGNAGMADDFHYAFQFLSPQQRALLWLAYVEGYKHAQIAAMLRLTTGSVRVLIFRARKKLVEILKSRGVEIRGES